MGTGLIEGMKCEKNENKKDGNKYLSHSICQMGGSKLESKSVTTGDYEKQYSMTSESTFTPPMAGVQGTKTTMVAKWTGACKAGQKPGDMIVNGQTMNLLTGTGLQPKK